MAMNKKQDDTVVMATDDIDRIIQSTGPRYKYQIFLVACMFYIILTTAENFVLSMFTGDEPAWRCVVMNNTTNEFCRAHQDEPIHSYDPMFSEKCRMNRSEWEFTTPASYSFVTEFDLTCERTYLAALISASFFMGGFLGTTFSGTIGDVYGRKPVLFVSMLFLVISSIFCSFIKTIWQFIGINLIRGAAAASNYYTLFVYLSEFMPASWRTSAAGCLLFAGPSSFMLFDLIAYLAQDWRMIQLYNGILPAFGIVLFAVLPESPRWLFTNEKLDEATIVLTSMNKFNGNGEKEICIKKKRMHTESVEPSTNKKYTYKDLLCTLQVFKITMAVCILWFAVTLVFYVIALQSSALGSDMYKTFALSTLADHAASIASIILLSRAGRKTTILSGLFLSGLLMGSLLLVPSTLSYKYTLNLIISTVARFSACTAFDGMFTWTIEIFPTVVRSQGMSLSVIFERVGMFCCPFITRVLQNISPNLPLVIMCALAVLASLLGLVLPETRNKPTREKYEDLFVDLRSQLGEEEIGVDNSMEVMCTE